MVYEIENKTSETVTFSGVEFPPNVKVEIFNDQTEEFEKALTLFQENRNDLGVLITKQDFSFLVDSVDVGANGFFEIANNWDKILTGIQIPYLEKLGNCFFDLKSNKLLVFNPLSNKWFSTQLSEEITE